MLLHQKIKNKKKLTNKKKKKKKYRLRLSVRESYSKILTLFTDLDYCKLMA